MKRRLLLAEMDDGKWRVVDQTDGHEAMYREYLLSDLLAGGLATAITDAADREAQLLSEAADYLAKSLPSSIRASTLRRMTEIVEARSA